MPLNQKAKITWGLLKRIWKYARPYRWWILCMLLMTLTTAGLGLITPLILRQLIDKTLPEKKFTPIIMADCCPCYYSAPNRIIKRDSSAV